MRIQDYQTLFQVHYWTPSSTAVTTTQVPNNLISNISFSFGYDVDRGIWPRLKAGAFSLTLERNGNTVSQSFDSVWSALKAMNLGTGFSFKWVSSWYGPNWYLDSKNYHRDEFGNETLVLSMVDVWTKIGNTYVTYSSAISQQTCYARANFLVGQVNSYYTNLFQLNLASYSGHSITKPGVPAGYSHEQIGGLLDNVLETDLSWMNYWAYPTAPGINYLAYQGRGTISAFPAAPTTGLDLGFSTVHSTDPAHWCIEELNVVTDTTQIIPAMRIALATDDTKTYYWSNSTYIQQFGQNYLEYGLAAVSQTDVNRFGTSIATTQNPKRVESVRTRLVDENLGTAKALGSLLPGSIVNVYDGNARDTINQWHRINSVSVNISQNEIVADVGLYIGNIAGEGSN